MAKRKRNPNLPSYENQEMSDAAYELCLFIENDGDLYQQQTLPIITNLQKKFTKGVYNQAAAVKLWKYLADAGAQKYTKDYGGSGNGSFGSFSVADRKQTAAWLADKYLEHVQEGYAFKTKPRAKNPAPRIGAASPRRLSQITHKPPTKRLVKRRSKNVRKGYFPNPVDNKIAMIPRGKFRYYVQVSTSTPGEWNPVWNTVAIFDSLNTAKEYVTFYFNRIGKKYPVRLEKI